jgi:hypothetical protein
MKSVDMNTVEFLSSTKYNLIDQFSKGDNEPPYDTDIGGTDDLKNVQYSADGTGYATIKYTRAYNTGDKYDYVVSPNTDTTISLAWNSGTINDHHNNFKITSVKINSSTPVVSAASTSSNTATTTPTTSTTTPTTSTATTTTTTPVTVPTTPVVVPTTPVTVPTTPVVVPTTPVTVPTTTPTTPTTTATTTTATTPTTTSTSTTTTTTKKSSASWNIFNIAISMIILAFMF